MEKFEILTEASLWYTLLCILVGAGYAFLLYSIKPLWSKRINLSLAAARFVIVFTISFLLLVPLIRQIKNYLEEPIIVLALDNSESMKADSSLYIEKVNAIKKELQNAGYAVEVNAIDATNDDKIVFDKQKTNLNTLLKQVASNYENRNLSSTILISDGIHNVGLSPDLSHHKFEIHTLGGGDTTTQRDIGILDVTHNKIAYTDNKFPIEVQLFQDGFKAKNVEVQLLEGGKLLASQSLVLENRLNKVRFYGESSFPGKKRYCVKVVALEGEFTLKNNFRDLYIDIIEGKQNVLIYALSPHPDIKAIKSAMAKKQSFQIDLVFSYENKLPSKKYDLIIFHQIPNIKQKGNAPLESLIEQNTNLWFICGNRSDFNKLNKIQDLVHVESGKQFEDVFPSLNTHFDKFNLEYANQEVFDLYPPLSFPMSNIKANNKMQTLLYQRIGTITTEKPILMLGENANEKKLAFLFGDGIWQWRLHEYSKSNNTDVFDEVITKMMQFITTKKDKRKLKVNPIKTEFSTNEDIVFSTEVYNDIYERVYNKKITLDLTFENGDTKTYTFTNSESNSKFNIGLVDKGIYKYFARIEDDKSFNDGGEFSVKEFFLESIASKADHDLLKRVAYKNGGLFSTIDQSNNIVALLKQKEHKKKVVFTDEVFLSVINLKWIFYVLLVLATLEWTTRKYLGDY